MNSRTDLFDESIYAVAGVLIFITAISVLFVSALLHDGGTLLPAWLAVGIVAPLYLIADRFALSRRDILSEPVGRAIGRIFVLVYFAVTFAFLAASHTKYAVLLALSETALVFGCVRGIPKTATPRIVVFVCALGSWAFTLGFPYTHLADWLMNATGSSALALPAMLLTLGLVTYVAVVSNDATSPVPRAIALLMGVAAVVAFTFLGLRTDNELSTWIPYHQSYFVSAAALVQDHHWLLWDVPSQYGFLSILTLAVTPGRTTYDGMYILTAIALLVQSTMCFIVLWWRDRNWMNYIFALILCCACFYSSQAAYYPFGARLYPQEGLRFLWPLAVLFFAFLHHRKRVTGLKPFWFLVAGHISWILSVLWSFETGLWSTIIWVAYLVGLTVEAYFRKRKARGAATLFLVQAASLAALLLAAFGIIQMVYELHFGHGPDWLGYVEFSSIYASASTFVVPFNTFGSGWTILLILTAIAALTIVDLRSRRYSALPILFACWAAVWGTSSYYVGEAFDQHVNMLAGIFVLVGAIIYWITQSGTFSSIVPLLARLSFVPMFALIIAYAIGAPSHIRKIRMPFFNAPAGALSDNLPVISGELLALERRANVFRTDKVLYPTSPTWVKLSTGIIYPLERNNGKIEQRLAWLPLSPSGADNMWLTLSLPRRVIYVERYLDDSRKAEGWYITYREPADCRQLSPRLMTLKRAETGNYQAVYCRFISGSKWIDTRESTATHVAASVVLPDGRRVSVEPPRSK